MSILEQRDRYKAIIDSIRLNLSQCDTEENVLKHTTIRQMAFMLKVIHHLVKETGCQF